MIPLRRPPAPPGWTAAATAHHDQLRSLGRAPTRKEIGQGYKGARDALREAQHRKCAWCEDRVRAEHHDVDHYRPCGSARRASDKSDEGYWWLSQHWDNLLFACAVCNRSWKKDWFPLEDDTHALQPGDPPPGRERPLLLDPFGTVHPGTVIRFHREEEQGKVRWAPKAINGSPVGRQTIRICGLAKPNDMRDAHLNDDVFKLSHRLQRSMLGGWDWEPVLDALHFRKPWVLATYDALEHYLPADLRATCPGGWPDRTQLPLPVRPP
jgi:hypothetical protein